MYMRAFIYRFVFIGAMSLGIVAGAFFNHPVAQAAPIAAAAKQTPAAQPAILPPVTLATVHVRPDAARSTTVPVAAHVETTQTDASADHHGSSMSLPTLRLDMPYYSFGKVLPRVGKE